MGVNLKNGSWRVSRHDLYLVQLPGVFHLAPGIHIYWEREPVLCCHSSLIVSEMVMEQTLLAGIKGAKNDVNASKHRMMPIEEKGISHGVPQ